MPTFEFTSPEGKTYEVAGPEGATREQAFGILQQQMAAGTAQPTEPSLTVRAGQALREAPVYLGRQLGLTARYGLEGLANTAQVVTEPLRLGTDLLLPNRGDQPKSTPLGEQATKLADTLGLPKPETPAERVVGDATRLTAGTAGGGALLSAASKVSPMLEGLKAATVGLPAQFGGAAGAGLAGGAVREAGGTPLEQFGGSVVGSLAGGALGAGIEPAIGSLRSLFNRPNAATIDMQLTRLMGPDYAKLPEAAKQAMREETAQALATGKPLDPVALGRLADFRAVGATPTRGYIGQDPGQITREANLAKQQANMAGGAGPGSLPALQADNNRAIIGQLNALGGASERNALGTGQPIIDAVEGTRTRLRGAEQAAWDAAKAHPGIGSPIEPNGLNAINARLGEEALTGFMNPTISRYMEAFQTGQQPFTAQHYANLRSMLSAELAKGGNEARAARAAVEALDGAPIYPIKAGAHIDFGNAPVPSAVAAAMRQRDEAAGQAIDLVNKARGATRAAYAFEESSPLVQTIVAAGRSADPEKIANSYLLNNGTTVRDAERVRDVLGPEGLQAMREGLATWIKKQALSGREDEVGNFSQSALNKAINSEKLAVFFSPEEVAQFKRVGRVASLIQNQTTGSAVNNSNTAGALIGRGMDLLQTLPGIGMVAQPMRDAGARIRVNMGASAAQNPAPALLNPELARRFGAPSLLAPGAAIAGSTSLLPPAQ